MTKRTRRIKRLIAFLLAAVTFAALSAQVSIVYGSSSCRGVIEDNQDALSADEESALLDIMYSAADDIGMNIGVLISDDLGGVSETQSCEYFADAYFKGGSGVVLLITAEGSGDTDWIYCTGDARDIYEQQQEHIFDAVYYGLDSGVSPNYKAAVEQFCDYLTNNRNGYTGMEPEDYDGIQFGAVLTDYQDALDTSEERELLEVIQSVADNIGANVGVVFSDSLNGKSESKYTDDFLDENFGADSSSIVLMLVREGSGNQDWISCTKHAYDIYCSQIDDIFDAVYYGMDSGISPNYPAAVREFCNYLENHKTGYAGSESASFSFHFGMEHIILLVVLILIPLIGVNAYAAGYKKRAPISARQYLDANRTAFTLRKDMFVREFTTSHRISSSSSGGHRGGGGGGGHSRSGGRGGGGGRHR